MDFRNCYAKFSQGDAQFQIGQRKWILGVIILVFFSPGFYFLFFEPESVKSPIWVAYLVLGFIFFAGVWCICFYRRALFDKASGIFHFERGFVFPFSRIEGFLVEIEYVELYSYVNRDGASRFNHATLYVRYRGRNLKLAEDGPGTNPASARRLAVLIGCGLKLTGRKDVWGVEKKEDYVETAQEARKNKQVLDSSEKL